MITGIVVNYNTQDLLKVAFSSVRKHHSKMPIIIIDGSDKENYCESLANENTTVVRTSYNIGHGRGMDLALMICQTPYALLFDSDIEMLKSPVESMLKQMDADTYGVGWINHIGEDGFDYGTPKRNHKHKIPYLHPYFALINVENYFKFKTFVHHGAPCYKSMRELYNKGKSGMLKQNEFVTGHTAGEGINWKGKPSKWIKHDFGGTRSNNRKLGIKEIDGIWEL